MGGSAADKGNATFWKPLETTDDLSALKQQSTQIPVLIFKHSTRCGISRMALSGFEKEFDPGLGIQAYFLDLLAHRELSNAVAQEFGVQHQSPQILVIRDGKSVFDASHGDIDAASLQDFQQ